ncbi:hypothetical protein V7794_30770 [Rhizobium laguerreae]
MNTTPEYLHFDDLDDWDEDDVVVVEIISNEIGNVRTHYPNRQSGPQPIEEAFDEAHRFLANDPNIHRIGVFIHPEAQWAPMWGVLIKRKQSLDSKPFKI